MKTFIISVLVLGIHDFKRTSRKYLIYISLIAISCSEKRPEVSDTEINDSTSLIAVESTGIDLKPKKFEPNISFHDFQTDKVDNGNMRAELDLNSHKYGRLFRTKIREAYHADTINFGGHYTIASWGCGSPCKLAVIVDRRTGKIYDAPDATVGYDFRADSRMLIVDPPDSSGFYKEFLYRPKIYVLDEATLKFNEHP